MVELELKDKPQSDEQRWVRESADADGWFRFKNPHSGRVLSVQTFSSITIAGMKKNFKLYSTPMPQSCEMTNSSPASFISWILIEMRF